MNKVVYNDTNLCGQCSGSRPNDVYRHFPAGHSIEDRLQLSIANVVLDHPIGELDKAASCPCRCMYHLEIADIMFDRDRVTRDGAVRLLEQPDSALFLAFPGDAIMPGEIGQRVGDTADRKIARRSDDYHLLDADLTRDQVRCVFKFADPHHKVDVFANQIDVSIREGHVEKQRRIAFSQFEQQRHDEESSERRRQINPHLTTGRVAREHERVFAAFEFGKRSHAMLEPSFSRWRQGQMARCPIEQF
nr:hypothetical protein [Rhizobium sp. P32RR-XVIII]